MCHYTLKCQSLQFWDSCSHVLRGVVCRHHQERAKKRLKSFTLVLRQQGWFVLLLPHQPEKSEIHHGSFTLWQITLLKILKICGHSFGFQSLFLINSIISEATCAVVLYSRNMSTSGRIILKILWICWQFCELEIFDVSILCCITE